MSVSVWKSLMPRSLLAATLMVVIAVSSPQIAVAQHDARKVLWFNGMPDIPPTFTTRHRRKMSNYVDGYRDGTAFDVTYTHRTSGGGLAAALSAAQYDIVVLDMTNRDALINAKDQEALRQFYGTGRSALMLDGSFAIRSIDINPTTKFPGVNKSGGGLLMNQMYALSENGGGILIGTDHDIWQPNANKALQAILPQAQFQGTTNPSTDGDFIGNVLLASRVIVTARDLLKHWESVPNQGEAPVGTFADFTGQTVTLFSLVETADKPGGGRKRPYISASFSPGRERIPIDSADKVFENMPTHSTKP
ncbi:hypothetical protein [Ascidiaceihabitans sp.]|uniref:hypothetical protein n=1 Tax=Ascidiaceihabitans sp. TaxID=1872644 RepID=UPI003297BAAB